MATFTWSPDYGAQQPIKPKVKRAQFGDGYSQRVVDGINNLLRSWNVSFKRSKTDADLIESFLATTKGADSFDWAPPEGATGKWIVSEDGWSRTIEETSHVISVVFEEVPA